jgi:hypothetical protein
MAAEHDEDNANLEYHVTVSLDRREWVARLTGPYLTAGGRTARHATLAGLHQAVGLLYPSADMERASRAKGEFGWAYSTTIDYDLGPDVGAHREALFKARHDRSQAWRDYNAHGRDAVTALALEHGASLSDIAEVLSVSRWEAARLLAYEPPHAAGFRITGRGVTHLLREHVIPYLAYAAPAAARQARILAADSLREVMQRRRSRVAEAELKSRSAQAAAEF